MNETRPNPLLELALVFLRLGSTAFGGPAAHLAAMEAEFVRRREWLTHEELVDLIGAANLVPGPNSTEVAIHIGYKRGGFPGLVVAGLCFILPAALIVSAIAWAYVRYGQLPSFQSAFYGIKPVVVAVVGQAILTLLRKVVGTWSQGIVLGLSVLLVVLGVPELGVLLGAGVVLAGKEWWKERSIRSALPVVSLLATVLAVAAIPIAWEALRGGPSHPTPLAIFFYFLKVGSVLYGSGYVLLAFLQGDLVSHWGWLSKAQLMDAAAVGQFTPGPVFTTATFIGYLLAGPAGAVAATVGIFMPAFVFVALSHRLIPRLRQSPVSSGFLDGINAAAMALMIVVLFQLGVDAFRDVAAVGIGVLALLALVRFRINSAWLILAGALVGYLTQ